MKMSRSHHDPDDLKMKNGVEIGDLEERAPSPNKEIQVIVSNGESKFVGPCNHLNRACYGSLAHFVQTVQQDLDPLRPFNSRSFDGFLARLRRRRPKSELFLPIFREAVKVCPTA